jgi:hypothetical protein
LEPELVVSFDLHEGSGKLRGIWFEIYRMVIWRTILKIQAMDEVMWEKKLSGKEDRNAFLKSKFFKISKIFRKLAGD